MQVVEVFQSLLLRTCASGHHMFFCVFFLCVNTLYSIRNRRCACLRFFLLNAQQVNELNDRNWMVD